MDFDRIKYLLMALAKANGVGEEDLNGYNTETDEFEWSINWKSDLNKSFEMDIDRFQSGVDLYEEALAKNDLLAAKAGLQDAKIASQDLANFFDAFREDLTKMMVDPRFKWPKFPDGYKVPEHYGYKNR